MNTHLNSCQGKGAFRDRALQLGRGMTCAGDKPSAVAVPSGGLGTAAVQIASNGGS